MNGVAPIPASIACAECGEPVNALTSFGVTVPLKSKVEPADFCSIGCLMDWSIDRFELETAEMVQ